VVGLEENKYSFPRSAPRDSQWIGRMDGAIKPGHRCSGRTGTTLSDLPLPAREPQITRRKKEQPRFRGSEQYKVTTVVRTLVETKNFPMRRSPVHLQAWSEQSATIRANGVHPVIRGWAQYANDINAMLRTWEWSNAHPTEQNTGVCPPNPSNRRGTLAAEPKDVYPSSTSLDIVSAATRITNVTTPLVTTTDPRRQRSRVLWWRRFDRPRQWSALWSVHVRTYHGWVTRAYSQVSGSVT